MRPHLLWVGELFVVVKLNKEYIIPFVGLNLGIHKFEYNITDTFFENFDYSIIHKGNVKVEFSLDKRETMMVGNFVINGDVETNCNRCDDPVNIPIEGDYQLIYKFGTEPTDDETLEIIYPEEFEIDISKSILEFITVSLPQIALHKEGECNEEMVELLSEYILVDEKEQAMNESENDSENDDDQDIDPRWEALRKLNK